MPLFQGLKSLAAFRALYGRHSPSLTIAVHALTISAVPDYTKHQRKIISGYYEHKDTIMLTKLQEIVSELYLADSESKAKRLWTRAGQALKNLKTPQTIIDHLIAQGKVELLAKHLQSQLSEKKK
ncbi:MAG: hypothetical protein HY287_00970 [Planctomycetes bacterium]|nr:hypothetical protein [Planctomycetota bacterium]